jgi:hypothetical protein
MSESQSLTHLFCFEKSGWNSFFMLYKLRSEAEFKLLRSSRLDTKESIPLTYVP